MNHSRHFLGTTLLLAHFGWLGALASAQSSIERISVPSGGGQADQDSGECSLSSDGLLIAFESGATNLVAGDSNLHHDIFVRDRVAGLTRRVSVSTAGVQGDLDLFSPRISADGRVVFFCGPATSLVAGDDNNAEDVFAHELSTGTTTRVSVATNGTQGVLGSWLGDCSADGRWVVFVSDAYNLVAGDTNHCADVFVRDRSAGTTTRVNVAPNGAQANLGSLEASISLDGRFVVFGSYATNLVANDATSTYDTFLRDLVAGTTELVTVSTQGVQANSFSRRPVVSGDGRFVAYESDATNLVAGDSNAVTDIFVRDRVNATTVRVSVDDSGIEGNGISAFPRICGSGRFVVFSSLASNLVPSDTNTAADVFAFDLASSTTRRISQTTIGVGGNGPAYTPWANAAGNSIAFNTYATNLVGGDTNQHSDVLVFDAFPLTPSTFCTAGTSTTGCVAQIAASAQPHASGGACQITVQGVEGLRSGLVFYGIGNAGFSPLAWGPSSSFLCVKSPIQRTLVQSSGGNLFTCTGVLQLDWAAYQDNHPTALGAPWSAGSEAFVQAWYRDPGSSKTTSLSDAVHLTYLP